MAEPVFPYPVARGHGASDLALLAEALPSMSEAQRRFFAREIQRRVSARVYAELCLQAGGMRAEFRCIDLIDQQAPRLIAGLILLAAGWLFAADMAMRGLTALGQPALAQGVGSLAWAGLFVVLPLWLWRAIARLRRRAWG